MAFEMGRHVIGYRGAEGAGRGRLVQRAQRPDAGGRRRLRRRRAARAVRRGARPAHRGGPGQRLLRTAPGVWQEPIYRNVWGLLASSATPRWQRWSPRGARGRGRAGPEGRRPAARRPGGSARPPRRLDAAPPGRVRAEVGTARAPDYEVPAPPATWCWYQGTRRRLGAADPAPRRLARLPRGLGARRSPPLDRPGQRSARHGPGFDPAPRQRARSTSSATSRRTLIRAPTSAGRLLVERRRLLTREAWRRSRRAVPRATSGTR